MWWDVDLTLGRPLGSWERTENSCNNGEIIEGDIDVFTGLGGIT